MLNRIFGMETEFGCMIRDDSAGSPEDVVELVKEFVFREQHLGVIDLHARDIAFEPAHSGGFLMNGARLYIDVVGSHEEYATPECQSLRDLVTHEKAGHRILQKALQELGLANKVSFHNNSVDHFGGHTFGCHENYLVDGDRFSQDAIDLLLPFLVTRQIFAGTGRVGGHRINRHSLDHNIMQLGEFEEDYVWVSNFYGVEIDDSVDYQLSQRADHIVKTISSRVRFNRAIINPKWDYHYNFFNFHRLHVLYGEANMSEYATMLKIGTTCLALDLVEMGKSPTIDLPDPLGALHSISRDPTLRWPVRLGVGQRISAVDLQRSYLSQAKRYLSNRDDDTDWVLREWERTLNDLDSDPMSTSDRLDWSAKKKMLQEYRNAEGSAWHDDILFSLDLEYHNINPSEGLFYALQDAGQVEKMVKEKQIEKAMQSPPSNTRAAGRGNIVRKLAQNSASHVQYVIDWDGVFIGRGHQLEMPDPFSPYLDASKELLEQAFGR